MSKLTDCLDTHTPRILDFPAGITTPPDPVPWALEMFKTAVIYADMQSMQANTGNDSAHKISFFDQKDPACFQRFRSAIQNGRPVHGSLELVDYRHDGGTLRKNADWAWHIFYDQFKLGLAEKHPMGYYFKATLWMSCGEHSYKAHCDMADGFLMHITGYKHVRVWPVPEQYLQKVIYKHCDFEGRMTSEPIDFELKPGQILFIPSGAMHEVVALGRQSAVSVSYHMGSPFPLLIFCAQLNELQPGAEISLPQHLSGKLKFDLAFFQLARFAHAGGGEDGESMPSELTEALLGVLKSNKLDSTAIRGLLSDWWRIALNQPIYPGPWGLPE